MSEVAVAFPDDEVIAGVMVSRLAAEGIAARIDRGLHGTLQMPSRGHFTVLVDERHAAAAREVLGTRARAEGPPSIFMRVGVLLLIAVLAFALAVLWIEVTR